MFTVRYKSVNAVFFFFFFIFRNIQWIPICFFPPLPHPAPSTFPPSSFLAFFVEILYFKRELLISYSFQTSVRSRRKTSLNRVSGHELHRVYVFARTWPDHLLSLLSMSFGERSGDVKALSQWFMFYCEPAYLFKRTWKLQTLPTHYITNRLT